jgi:hypothetical protein
LLAPYQIQQFMELGCCQIEEAFTRTQASAVCDLVWSRMAQKVNIRRQEPGSWPTHYDIEERLSEESVIACFSDKLAMSVSDLIGKERWNNRRAWGFWPVNFSFGANEASEYPDCGWHVDGNWFMHSIDCPKQGLLVIGLFTDIESRGGGTVLALGSHKRTARILAEHPEGLTHTELFEKVLKEPIGNFFEITGCAGDVFLAHPFLFHTRGFKRRGAPRIISNTEAGLRRPMNISREGGQYSVLENSIRLALQESPIKPSDAKLCRF